MVQFNFILDIKEYIASGIIESYVLGSLSNQETREVECMSHIYPEIKEHLVQLQSNIEEWASANAVIPPSDIKSKVLAKIKSVQQESDVKSETKIVSINRSNDFFKYAAAASVFLLLGTAYLWYNSSNELELTAEQLIETEGRLDELQADNASLLAENSTLDTEIKTTNRNAELLAQANTQVIELKGTDSFKESLVRVYWNQTDGLASFVIDNLPEPPTALQYQLWAIVDGTPMSLGVFDLDNSQFASSIRTINEKITSSQAFAITLEQLGGSPTPNLEALVVIGEV